MTSKSSYLSPSKDAEIRSYFNPASEAIATPYSSISSNAMFPQQPSAYGPITNGGNMDGEALLGNQADLTARFRKCGYCCYKYTVLVLFLVCGLLACLDLIDLFSEHNMPFAARSSQVFIQLFQTYILILSFLAVHRRDLQKAERATLLWMFFIPIYIILMTVVVMSQHSAVLELGEVKEIVLTQEDFEQGRVSPIVLFTVAVAMEVGIYLLLLYGSTKVRNVLRQHPAPKGEERYYVAQP